MTAISFFGSDLKFAWNVVPPDNWVNDGTEWQDPYLKDYRVRLLSLDGTVVYGTWYTTTRQFNLTKEENMEATGGNPLRDFLIGVSMRDLALNVYAEATQEFTNPAPATPTVTCTPTPSGFTIDVSKCTETDYSATRVWISTINGFTITDGTTPTYDAPQTHFSYPASTAGPYYVVAGHYDDYSNENTALNLCAQVTVTPTSFAPPDVTPPATPTGLALSSSITHNGDGSALILLIANWTANSEPDLNGYELAIQQGSGAFTSEWTGATTTQFRWVVLANATYTVKILAYDKSGNKSAYSATHTLTTTYDTTAPAVPTSLVATGGIQCVFLTWNNAADVDTTGANVYENTVNTPGTATLIANVGIQPSGPGFFTRTGLATGATRYYWITNVDTSGNESAKSTGSGAVTTVGVGGGDLDTTPPAVPTGLSLSSTLTLDTDGTQIIVLDATWTANTDTDLYGYEIAVEQASLGFFDYTCATNSFELKGVPANTSYTAKVCATDTTGNRSAFTATQTITTAHDTTAPAAPTSVSATGAINAIFLQWTNPTAADLDHVDIYENTTNSSGSATKIAHVKAVSAGPGFFTRDGIATGATRFYWLKAVDTSGNASGFSSVATTAAVAVGGGDLDTTPPAVPTGLGLSTAIQHNADGSQAVEVTATWTANGDADLFGYDVAIQQGSSAFVSVPTNTNSYYWVGLIANTSYTVKVLAVDTTGNRSAYCATQTITSAADTSAPGAPTGLSATGGIGSVFLQWTNPTVAAGDLSHVDIYENSTNSSGSATKIGSVNAVSAGPGFFTRDGIASGSAEFYWLKAVDTSGNASAFSAGSGSVTPILVGSGDVDTTAPAVPTGLSTASTLTLDTDGHQIITLTATWTANTDVDLHHYEVRSTVGGVSTNYFIGILGAPTWSLVGALANTSYSIVVRAADIFGNLSAYTSASVITTTKDTTAPGAPTSLAGTGGIGAIYLTWTNPTAADLHHVDVYENTTNSSGSATKIAQVLAASAAPGFFARTGLTTGTAMFYWLKAVDTSGNASGFSTGSGSVAAVVVGTGDVNSTTLVTPTGLTLSSALTLDTDQTQQVDLVASWTANTDPGLDGYDVLVQINSGSFHTYKAAVQGAPHFYLAANATNTYNVQVRAFDIFGNVSAYCGVQSLTPTADTTPPSAPTGLSVTPFINSNFLAWTNPSAADLATVEVFSNSTNSSGTSTKIATIKALPSGPGSYTHNNTTGTQTFYWLKGVDTSGNESGFSTGANGTPVTVATTDIAANAITAAKIAANTITAAQIAAGTITATQIATSTITATQIAAGTITAANIAASTITASRLVLSDTANMIPDVNFTDTSFWSVSSVTQGTAAISTDTNITTTLGAPAGVSHIATGTSGTGQSSQVFIPPAQTVSCEPNVVYRVSLSQLNKVGFKGLGRIQIVFYGSDQATNLQTTNVNGSDFRLSAVAGSDVQELINSQVTSPAGAAYMRFSNLCTWPTSAAGAGTLFQAIPRVQRAAAADLLVDGTIVGTKLVANTITATQIAANTITASQIAANTITAGQIAANTITASQIAAGTITATQIAATTITAAKIVSGTITTTQIAANTIVAGNIAAGTITATQIASNTITAANIAAGTITATQIAAGTITASRLIISDTANMIPDVNFTDANYWTLNSNAAGTVGYSSDATYIHTDLGAPTGIVHTALGVLAAGTANATSGLIPCEPNQVYRVSMMQVSKSGFRGKGLIRFLTYAQDGTTNIQNLQTITGTDFTTSPAGSDTIEEVTGQYTTAATAAYMIFSPAVAWPSSGTVGAGLCYQALPRVQRAATADLLVDGTIVGTKLVANTITATQIAANTITAGQIAASTITTTQIAANTIVAGDIAANTITAGQIAAGTITATQIASNTITAANIAAGTITASRLIITDEGNMLPDVYFTDQGSPGWTLANTTAYTVAFSSDATNVVGTLNSPTGVKFTGASSTSGLQTLAKYGTNLPVEPGKPYRFACTFLEKNGFNGRMFLNFVTLQSDGVTQITNFNVIGTDYRTVALSGGDHLETVTQTITVDANAAYAFFQIVCQGSTTLSSGSTTAYAAQPRVNRANNGDLIVDGSIVAGKLVANTITASQIAANTITASQIAAGTITATQIASATITATQIAANTITASQIAANTITASQIAAGTITATNIAAGAIVASKLTLTDTANMVPDVNFTDTSYWSLIGNSAGTVTYSTDATYVQTDLNAPKGIVHTALGVLNATLTVGNSGLIPCEPSQVYRVSFQQVNKSGFRGQGIMRFLTYEQDGTTNIQNLQTITGTDFRTSPAGSDTIEEVSGQYTTASNAAYILFSFGCKWPSSGTVGAGLLYQAAPRMQRAASADLLVDGTIVASKIVSGTLTTTQIAANTITAGNMNVATLSAITANIGTVTSGLIQNAAGTTKFDLTNSRSIYTGGSTQLVLGTAFGASSNLIEWYGASATAIGSMTTANAIRCTDTTGNCFFNGVAIGTPTTNPTFNQLYNQSTDPAPVADGAIWLKTSTSKLYFRIAGSWVLIGVLSTPMSDSDVIFDSSTSGSYSVPVPSNALTHVDIFAFGGGGGAHDQNAHGGGGSGYTYTHNFAVTAGTTVFTVTVGNGGLNASTPDSIAAHAGFDSTVTCTGLTTMTAHGGGAASSSAAGSGGTGVGGTTTNTTGENGDLGTAGNGGANLGTGGIGPTGGARQTAAHTNGNPPGGGASSGNSIAQGAAGRVVIYTRT